MLVTACNSKGSSDVQLCDTNKGTPSNSSGDQFLCMTVPVFATAGATGVPGACTELALLCGNDTALSLWAILDLSYKASVCPTTTAPAATAPARSCLTRGGMSD